MRILYIFLLGLLSVLPPDGRVVTGPEVMVREFMRAGEVPGLFAAVVKGDSVLFQQAFGVADIEHGTPMTARTCMELGSISKAFTAEVLIDLYYRGLLNLDDPITRYLPSAPATWSSITINHLLTHSSGIQNYLLDPRFGAERYFQPVGDDDPLAGVLGGISADSLTRMFYSLPIEFAPGQTWSYSNTGYILLGKIAESVTHTPYFAYAAQTVTLPLGMRQTKACEEAWKEGCLARGYVVTSDGLRPARVLTSDYAFSGGAWAVSGEDMVSFLRAVHRKGLPSDRAGFNWRSRALFTDHPFLYNGGRFFSTFHGKHITAHNGGTPGFSSSWMLVEEDTISVIVLMNRQDYAPVDRLAWDLLAHYAPELQYPYRKIESPDGEKWGTIVLGALDSLRAGGRMPSGCSAPLRRYLESDNGRGIWHWYFARGFPTAISCVDAEDADGLKQYRYRLTAQGAIEYRLTAVVDRQDQLVRLSW